MADVAEAFEWVKLEFSNLFRAKVTLIERELPKDIVNELQKLKEDIKREELI